MINKSNILVIGDFILDKYVRGNVKRISPESPSPVLNFKNSGYSLGGAGNVASNLVDQNNNVYFLTVLGNDFYSKISKKLLSNKIKKVFIFKQQIKTTLKTRFQMNNHQFLRLDEEEKLNLNKHSLEKIKKKIFSLKNIHVIYIADYNKGLITAPLVDFIKKHAKSLKIPIFVDPKNNDLKVFKNVSFIKPNLDFLSKVTNLDLDVKSNIKKAIRAIAIKYNIPYFILTLGSKGSLTYQKKNNKFLENKAEQVEVYDLSGAGDTFGSTFINYYLKNKNISDSLTLAHMSSALAVRKIGTASISEKEIENFYNHKFKVIDAYNFSHNKNEIKNKLKSYHLYKIGFTNGCFDIIHPGHIDFLKKCKKQCELLIVGLNSDNSVKKLKGKKRPIINQKFRSYQLMNLNIIDMIIIFDQNDPLELIKFIKPDVLFKGSEYKKNEIIGEKFMSRFKKNTVRIKTLNKKLFSSSNFIKKV
jgi:D-beta-D-heptose 7-phosphate kinase/D-beta-D-heptose 1-phosphate adenosyltransferase